MELEETVYYFISIAKTRLEHLIQETYTNKNKYK